MAETLAGWPAEDHIDVFPDNGPDVIAGEIRHRAVNHLTVGEVPMMRGNVIRVVINGQYYIESGLLEA